MSGTKRKIVLTAKAAAAAAFKKPRMSKAKASVDASTGAGPASGAAQPTPATPAEQLVASTAAIPSVPLAKAVAAPSDDRRARVDDVPDEETAEEELSECHVSIIALSTYGNSSACSKVVGRASIRLLR